MGSVRRQVIVGYGSLAEFTLSLRRACPEPACEGGKLLRRPHSSNESGPTRQLLYHGRHGSNCTERPIRRDAPGAGQASGSLWSTAHRLRSLFPQLVGVPFNKKPGWLPPHMEAGPTSERSVQLFRVLRGKLLRSYSARTKMAPPSTCLTRMATAQDHFRTSYGAIPLASMARGRLSFHSG